MKLLKINSLLAGTLALVLVAGLGMSQAFAQSTPQVQITIDFSSGVYSGQTNCADPCLYTEDGFTFATPDVADQHFDSPSNPFITFHQGGANTVDQVVLSQFGGQPFDLVSFDIVNPSTCQATGTASVLVESNLGHSVNILSGVSGTQILNWNNVLSVTFTAGPEDVAASGQPDDVCIDNLIFDDEPTVGGLSLPIETTSLILAGAQSFSWMIPVVLSVLGIGLFVVSRKSKNS